MAAFHSEVAAGRSPARALQRARRELRGDGDVARFYRGMIQVHGLGQYPVR